MINFVDGGHDVLDHQNYTQMSQGTLNFFNNQMQQWGQIAQQTGNAFMQQAFQQAQELASIDMAAKANALARKNAAFWKGDNIRPLLTIGDMQQAPPSMIRWMMCQPDYRKRWLQNGCEGYGTGYINVQGTDVGVDQYDYQRVYNGLVIDDGEDCYARNFHVDTIEGDVELSVEQRFDIMESHDVMKQLLDENGFDPGDPLNGHL